MITQKLFIEKYAGHTTSKSTFNFFCFDPKFVELPGTERKNKWEGEERVIASL